MSEAKCPGAANLEPLDVAPNITASPSPPSTALVICTLLSDLGFGKLQASAIQDAPSVATFYSGATFENKGKKKKNRNKQRDGWRVEKAAVRGGTKSWLRVSRVTKFLVDEGLFKVADRPPSPPAIYQR